MSEQKCETCTHYQKYPIVKNEGECTDPTKAVFVQGTPINQAPSVFDWSFCLNHEPNPLTYQSEGDRDERSS